MWCTCTIMVSLGHHNLCLFSCFSILDTLGTLQSRHSHLFLCVVVCHLHYIITCPFYIMSCDLMVHLLMFPILSLWVRCHSHIMSCDPTSTRSSSCTPISCHVIRWCSCFFIYIVSSNLIFLCFSIIDAFWMLKLCGSTCFIYDVSSVP